jgi:hypothetical protein
LFVLYTVSIFRKFYSAFHYWLSSLCNVFRATIFFWEKVSCNFKICLNWKTSGFRSNRDDHPVHGLLAVRAVRALQSNLLPLPHLRHRPHVQGHLQYHPRGSNGKFKFHVFDEWMNYVSN